MTARVPSLSSFLLDSAAQGAAQPDSLLAALRQELERTTTAGDRARLLHATARLQERRGQLPEATQDYLEATNTEPADMAPLQGLIGLALRRASDKNLAPLLERLRRLAHTAGEKQQAYLLMSELERRAREGDAARATLEQWLSELPDDPAAWLALDVVASQVGDASLSERARTGRASAAREGRWRALLLLDCAELRAQAGDAETALDLCRQAADEHACLPGFVFWERCAVRLERWTSASEAAERAAALLSESLDDPAELQRLEAARWQSNPHYASLLILRAAEWARRGGDADRARRLLDRCAQALPSELLPRLSPLLLPSDGAPDPKQAPPIEAELERLGDGHVAAALWLELAAAAEHAHDDAGLKRAVEQALARDPASLRARSAQLEFLEAAGTPTEFAGALEDFATRLGASQGDCLLSAALIAAADTAEARPARAARVQQLLRSARETGADPNLVARSSSILAHLLGDPRGYEAALGELARARTGLAEERKDIALGLFRSALLRATRIEQAPDQPLADAPLEAALASASGDIDLLSATLRALVLPLWSGCRSAEDSARWEQALAEIAQEGSLPEAAELLTVRRLLESGHELRAAARLRALLEKNPSHTAAAAALADLLSTEDPSAAAEVLASAAPHQADSEVRGAWLLRAGRLLWLAAKPARALALAEDAVAFVPRAAHPFLVWGSRSQGADDLTARARLLEREQDDRGPFIALERATLALLPAGESVPRDEGSLTEAPASPEQQTPCDSERWLFGLLRASRGLGAGRLDPELDALPGAPVGSSAAVLHGALLHEALRRSEASDPSQVLESAALWARSASAADGLVSALSWLAASRAASDRASEVDARDLLGQRLAAPELRASAVNLASLTAGPRREELGRELRELARSLGPDAPKVRALHFACLELATPGVSAGERADALAQMAEAKCTLASDAGGDPSSVGALWTLAGFNRFHDGDLEAAAALFRKATETLPDDVAGWEGLRAVAAASGDARQEAEVSIELAQRTCDDQAAAALWERAGVLLGDVLADHSRAEEAFASALARDSRRETAFQRLYLLARGRADTERLLELVDGRLSAVDDPRQVAELLWEKARLAQRLGDEVAALRTLEQLLGREPRHLGALALAGELCLRRKQYEGAARWLSQLAGHDGAPARQRLIVGLSAADIYEQKLGKSDLAASVLRGLHEAGLGGAELDERLALDELRAGRWAEAAAGFERLLAQTTLPEIRAAAAAFLLALYRDQLPSRERAIWAAQTLLAERPSDADALAFIMEELEHEEREPLVQRALEELRRKAAAGATAGAAPDPGELELLARLAQDIGWRRTAVAAHGALRLIGKLGDAEWSELAAWTERSRRTPSSAAPPLSAADLAIIASPLEAGPWLTLAARLSATCQSLTPPLEDLGALEIQLAPSDEDTRRAPGARSAEELRAWADTLGLGDLRLYAGGSAAAGISGRAGAEPSLVFADGLGELTGVELAEAVGLLYALRRGTAWLLEQDEAGAALIVAAAARVAGVAAVEEALCPESGSERLAEISRTIADDIDEQSRAELASALSQVLPDRQGFALWYRAAQRSAARMGVLCLGEPSAAGHLIDQTTPRERDGLIAELTDFVVSGDFVRLRELLGLEGE